MVSSAADRIKKRLKAVASRSENQFCCDCGDKKPTWASIIVPPDGVSPSEVNHMGAFCCFHCSGAHRRLGVHICFVRSITLDDWKEKEVEAVEIGGNRRVNACFEANLSTEQAKKNKPNPRSDLEVRDQFIKAKYQKREYFDPTKYKTSSSGKKASPVSKSPAKSMDFFAGVAEENFFSNSKRNLFENSTKISSSQTPRRRSSMPIDMDSMTEGRLFEGMSSEDLFSASKTDIVNSFFGSSGEPSTNGWDNAKSVEAVSRIDLLQGSFGEKKFQNIEMFEDPPLIPNPKVHGSLSEKDGRAAFVFEPLNDELPSKPVVSKPARNAIITSRHARQSRSPGRVVKQLGRRPRNSTPDSGEKIRSLQRSRSADAETGLMGSNHSRSRRRRAGYSKSPGPGRVARLRGQRERSNSGSPTRQQSNEKSSPNYLGEEKDFLAQSERSTRPSSFRAKSGRKDLSKVSKGTRARHLSLSDDSEHSAEPVRPASFNHRLRNDSDHSTTPARPLSFKHVRRESMGRSKSHGTSKSSKVKNKRGERTPVRRAKSSDSLKPAHSTPVGSIPKKY